MVSATELEGFDEVDDEPAVHQPVATEASAEVCQPFTPSSAVALLGAFRVTARMLAICTHVDRMHAAKADSRASQTRHMLFRLPHHQLSSNCCRPCAPKRAHFATLSVYIWLQILLAYGHRFCRFLSMLQR